jgi:hypothetical protein
MNLNELQNKLLAAARVQPQSDRVPYAFEKRVMARLASTPNLDPLAWWARALWRGAAACVAVSLLLSIWSVLPLRQDRAQGSFSEELADTILAATPETDNTW